MLYSGVISQAAYAVLLSLFSPNHGDIHDIAALLFQKLSPVMLGAAPNAQGKITASEATATKAAAVNFVETAYR